MNQMAMQTVAALWAQVNQVGPLGTPARNAPFVVGQVSDDMLTVLTGESGTARVVIPKTAFEATLHYLSTNAHHAGNPCVIGAANDPEKAGPLCRASRQLPSGKFGVRNITYILPVLQALGIVQINRGKSSTVWLLNQPAASVQAPRPVATAGIESATGELTPDQQAFADHLAALWGGPPDSFVHRYATTHHRAWNTWKALNKGSHWWCSTLRQAAAHYSWYQKAAPDDFASVASRLRAALAAYNDREVEKACHAIFDWGNVALGKDGGARLWLAAEVGKGTLCKSIHRAVELLQPNAYKSLAAFDGQRLLMNSTMTKVYAAADPTNIIIYDGRVGAALGLLARRWLSVNGRHAVPPGLAFGWGGKRDDKAATRNPSREGFMFMPLGYHPHQVLRWAELVRISNGILKRVVATLHTNGEGTSVVELERALFMVGFNVSE